MASNYQTLFGGGRWPSGGRAFSTADDCLAFMFGPADHDAHVRRYRTDQHLVAANAAADAGDARVRAFLEDLRESNRARRSALEKTT